MTAYNHTTVNLAVIIGGAGVVAIILGLAWYRLVSPDNFDKDTARFVVKMFAGIAIAMLLLMLFVRYA